MPPGNADTKGNLKDGRFRAVLCQINACLYHVDTFKLFGLHSGRGLSSCTVSWDVDKPTLLVSTAVDCARCWLDRTLPSWLNIWYTKKQSMSYKVVYAVAKQPVETRPTYARKHGNTSMQCSNCSVASPLELLCATLCATIPCKMIKRNQGWTYSVTFNCGVKSHTVCPIPKVVVAKAVIKNVTTLQLWS